MSSASSVHWSFDNIARQLSPTVIHHRSTTASSSPVLSDISSSPVMLDNDNDISLVEHESKSSNALIEVMHSKFSHMSIERPGPEIQVDVFGSGLDRITIRNMLPTYAATVKGAIDSNNQDYVTAIVTRLRKYLSMEKIHNAVDNVLALSILPRLTELLSYTDAPDILLYELCWVLTNIAAGSTSQTTCLVETPGLVSRLTEIVSTHTDSNVQTQALWCLGNIVGDNSELRDIVVEAGALHAAAQFAHQRLMLNQTQPNPSIYNESVFATSRIIAWFSSNASRGVESFEDWPAVMPLVPVLEFLLLCPDVDTVCDTTWAISKILLPLQFIHTAAPSLCTPSPVTPTLAANLMRVLSLKSFEDNLPSSTGFTRLRQPALRSLVNLSTGDDNHVQQIIDAGLIPILYELIRLAIPGQLLLHLPNLPGANPHVWESGPTIPEYLAKDALLVLANIAAAKNWHLLHQFLESAPIAELWFEILAIGVIPGYGAKLRDGSGVLDNSKSSGLRGVSYLETKLDVDIVREAAWGIANITTSRRPEVLDRIIKRSNDHHHPSIEWRNVLIAGLGAGTSAPNEVLGLIGAPLLTTTSVERKRKYGNHPSTIVVSLPTTRRSARLGTTIAPTNTCSNSPGHHFLSVREKCADALLNMAVILVPRGWLTMSHVADIDKVMTYVARTDSITRSKYALVRDLIVSGRLSDEFVEHTQRSMDEVMAALEVFSMDSNEIESKTSRSVSNNKANHHRHGAITLSDSATSLSLTNDQETIVK